MLSLNDGRDLLHEVTNHKWRVGMKLQTIVELLPQFTERVLKLEQLYFMGTFHF
jgi:hypothetical protein